MKLFDFNNAGPQRPEQMDTYHDEPTTDPITAFLDVLAGYGLHPDHIDTSGNLVRFDTEKKGDKAGWYAYHPEGIPSASYGDWRSGLKEYWCAKDFNTLTWEERKIQNERRKQDRIRKRKMMKRFT